MSEQNVSVHLLLVKKGGLECYSFREHRTQSDAPSICQIAAIEAASIGMQSKV